MVVYTEGESRLKAGKEGKGRIESTREVGKLLAKMSFVWSLEKRKREPECVISKKGRKVDSLLLMDKGGGYRSSEEYSYCGGQVYAVEAIGHRVDRGGLGSDGKELRM